MYLKADCVCVIHMLPAALSQMENCVLTARVALYPKHKTSCRKGLRYELNCLRGQTPKWERDAESESSHADTMEEGHLSISS